MKQHKGQALLFVIVTLTIALVIAVAVSARVLSSVSRTTRTDTSSRELAAAEGAAEIALKQSIEFFQKISDNTNNQADCRNLTADADYYEEGGEQGCVIDYQNGVRAIVDATVLPVTHVIFQLPLGKVREVPLEGYTGNQVRICWNGNSDQRNQAMIHYIAYSENGNTIKGGFMPTDFVPQSNPGRTTGFTFVDRDNSGINPGQFHYCSNYFNLPGQVYGLRIRSLYNHATVGVYPENNKELPPQGYQIVSTGQLFSGDQVQTSRIIRVTRSFNYVPGVMDFALYSKEGISK